MFFYKGDYKVQVGSSSKICKRSHLAPSRCNLAVILIWLNAFTGFNDGEVKFHLLGNHTVVFVLYDSVGVDANVSNFFWDRRCLSRRTIL